MPLSVVIKRHHNALSYIIFRFNLLIFRSVLIVFLIVLLSFPLSSSLTNIHMIYSILSTCPNHLKLVSTISLLFQQTRDLLWYTLISTLIH